LELVLDLGAGAPQTVAIVAKDESYRAAQKAAQTGEERRNCLKT
jgi:hypothetical protein